MSCFCPRAFVWEHPKLDLDVFLLELSDFVSTTWAAYFYAFFSQMNKPGEMYDIKNKQF